MSETARRRFLYLAGIWNVLGGVSALAGPERHFAQMYNAGLSLADPLAAFFYRATWINVIAWGVGYIMAARNPRARTPILLAGGAGKLAYFCACLALYLSGAGNRLLLATGILDVIVAVVFACIVWFPREDYGGSR